MSFGGDSGPVGYGAADDMSSRVHRYYRNGFPKVPEKPSPSALAAGLIAAGLRFGEDSSTAPVSEPTSSSEAVRVERYYRNRVTRMSVAPAFAESGLETADWVSLDSQEVLASSVQTTSGTTSSEGSASCPQSPTTSTSGSTSPTPSLRSAEDKQPEMVENKNTGDEMKTCSVC